MENSDIVESGDTVKHLSDTLINVLPMTVYEIENDMAFCGTHNDELKFIGDWYKQDELIIITKGNVQG